MHETVDEQAFLRRHGHWLFYAVGYAAVLFCLVYPLGRRNVVALLLSAGVYLTIAELVAIWCVYGPGSLPKRISASFLLALIPLAAIHLAIYANTSMPKEGKHVATAVCYLFPFICCAAQIPHWLVRLAFGWQFTLGNHKPSVTFKISDLLFITLMIALAFTGIRLAASNYLKILPDEQIAEITIHDINGNDSGQPTNRRDLERGVPIVLFFYSLPVMVWTAAKLPIVFFTFCGGSALKAFIKTGLFIFASIFALFLVVSYATGVVAGLAGGFALLVGFVTLSVFALAIPLLHSRARGLQFKRFKRENVESAAVQN